MRDEPGTAGVAAEEGPEVPGDLVDGVAVEDPLGDAVGDPPAGGVVEAGDEVREGPVQVLDRCGEGRVVEVVAVVAVVGAGLTGSALEYRRPGGASFVTAPAPATPPPSDTSVSGTVDLIGSPAGSAPMPSSATT